MNEPTEEQLERLRAASQVDAMFPETILQTDIRAVLAHREALEASEWVLKTVNDGEPRRPVTLPPTD